MIGDELETDISGARESGIDQVYLNSKQIPHDEKVTYEIRSLAELKGIL